MLVHHAHLLLEGVCRHRGQRVGSQTDLCKLVCLDLGQEVNIGHVQDFLVRAIVRLQLVRRKDTGCFESIQSLRVRRTELVKRLACVTDNEQRAIKLVHQTKQVDKLEDRVILYLVNDEVADVQPSRQRHLVDHLVSQDDLKL